MNTVLTGLQQGNSMAYIWRISKEEKTGERGIRRSSVAFASPLFDKMPAFVSSLWSSFCRWRQNVWDFLWNINDTTPLLWKWWLWTATPKFLEKKRKTIRRSQTGEQDLIFSTPAITDHPSHPLFLGWAILWLLDSCIVVFQSSKSRWHRYHGFKS